MARNEEKANFMLNRWTSMKQSLLQDKQKDRRPYLASECSNLAEAEKWRKQIIHEISSKVKDIQNAGLGETRIRELNDEINKLFREKHHWEKQIKALNGPDYISLRPKILDTDDSGITISTGGGSRYHTYRYFGAAKDLPGVKEMLEKSERVTQLKRSRHEIERNLTMGYFGFSSGKVEEEEKISKEILAADERFSKERSQVSKDDIERVFQESIFMKWIAPESTGKNFLGFASGLDQSLLAADSSAAVETSATLQNASSAPEALSVSDVMSKLQAKRRKLALDALQQKYGEAPVSSD
jgi:pre-mRNA-splicing factor ISY1